MFGFYNHFTKPDMTYYRRHPDWEWYLGEAQISEAMHYARTGKISIPGPFLLVLFSMFYEDMIAWCNENPALAAFHDGDLGFFTKLKYCRYRSRVILRGKDNKVLGGFSTMT